jgi:calcium/calmodulin-dependent protein kinase I
MVFRPGPSWWIKITDFGISKRTNDMVTGTLEIGTVAFMAPELRGMCGPEEAETAGGYREYPNAVDIWAIGEITHRLLTQEPLFATGRQLSHYVFLGASFPSEKLQNFGSSRDAIDFVIRCMDAAPSRRLTALDALNHSWLANHEFITEPEHFEPPQK